MKMITSTSSCTLALLLILSACTQDSDHSHAKTAAKSINTDTAKTVESTTIAATSLEGNPKYPRITVYKSPTCGCCSGWVEYLKDEGLPVTAIDTDDVDTIKAENGLTKRELMSCHTALVDGYVIEGHVPVADIKRLLSEKPKNIKGLTAPGMPMYSPGMASLIPKDYDVLSFTESGETAVYSSY